MSNVALYNTFEGGTSGTTLTTGNTGANSGDAFGLITGTPKFSVAQTHSSGKLCCDCSTGVGATATNPQFGPGTIANAGADFWCRFYGYQTAAPVTTNTHIFAAFDDTGTPVRSIALRITASTGAWGFYNAAGTLYTGTAGAVALPTNQWFRFDLRLNGNTSTGLVEAFFYTGALLESPIGGPFTDHVLGTGLAISGSGNLPRLRYGPLGTVAASYTYFVDDVGYSEVSWIGSSLPQADPSEQLRMVPGRGAMISMFGAFLRNQFDIGVLGGGGATTTPLTLSASMTALATPVWQTQKQPAASITATPTIQQQTAKPISAGVTALAVAQKQGGKPFPAAAVSALAAIQRQAAAVRAAAITTSAATQRQAGKAPKAPITATALIQKQVGHPLAAGVTATALITKQVGKQLRASVTAQAAITTIKASILTLAASTTVGAFIQRQAGKAPAASMTATGKIAKQAATTPHAQVTATASMTRQPTRILAATITTVATLQRQPAKVLRGVVTTAAAIAATVTGGGGAAQRAIVTIIDFAKALISRAETTAGDTPSISDKTRVTPGDGGSSITASSTDKTNIKPGDA